MRSDGSSIGEEGNGSEDFRDLGFSGTFESEGRGNERMLEFEVEVKKKKNSPTVAIQSNFMRFNDYFIKFLMS